MYCIVDLETTGGNANRNQIIEIGACLHNGHEVVDVFHTHINPQINIPPFITRLTGISNDTVADAPVFEEIAEDFHDFLGDSVFIAHNVQFDYRFVKSHFNRADIQFNSRRLCTVRLSRKLLPNLSSYSLGNICQALKIPIKGRHTALGDATATTELFSLLLNIDKGGLVEKSIKRNSRESLMPPNLPKAKFDELPEKMGIYFMKNKEGKPIYIGQSINIKSRIAGHFSTHSERSKRLRFFDEIHDISYKLCPNELIMDLEECHAIKKYWPRYNSTYKKRAKSFGLYHYFDSRQFIRFHINQVLLRSKPLLVFPDYVEAFQYTKDLCQRQALCPKLCGLQKAEHDCLLVEDGSCDDACSQLVDDESYRKRSKKVLQEIQQHKETFLLVGKGFDETEKTFVLVEKGKYRGYGYTTKDLNVENIAELKEDIIPQKASQDVEGILRTHMGKINSEQLLV